MTAPAAAPFVAQLRSRPGAIRLGPPGAATITVRVQVSEVWDVVRVDAPPTEPILAVKTAALAALVPDGAAHEDFVTKLRGYEVLDERASLEEAGAVNGSIFILVSRRRRPVR